MLVGVMMRARPRALVLAEEAASRGPPVTSPERSMGMYCGFRVGMKELRSRRGLQERLLHFAQGGGGQQMIC